jgi:xanthine dehydrogenase accessory factor
VTSKTKPFQVKLHQSNSFIGNGYFVQEVIPKGKVFIFGGGHVSKALVPVLRELDFYCVVLEDREDFLTEKLFPTANERILTDFNEISKKITVTKRDYAVIITRSHKLDYELQKQLLDTDAYYIGVMGSKKKTTTQRKMLEEDGYSLKNIERIKMPIGLDIKAETVKELAISIAAELIKERKRVQYVYIKDKWKRV